MPLDIILIVSTVTECTNGKLCGQVEIKRTIPKGSGDSKDFKTKKIFVGGIPTAVTEGTPLYADYFSYVVGLCIPIKLIVFTILINIYLLSVFHVDEFKSFFSKYGKVVEHEIIRDHVSKRSRGFGFIVFDNEQVVDNILTDGNMIDMAGTQVSLLQSPLFLYIAVLLLDQLCWSTFQ